MTPQPEATQAPQGTEPTQATPDAANDQAKDPAAVTPEFSRFRPLLESLLLEDPPR